MIPPLRIPLADPGSETLAMKPQIMAAMECVLDGGAYILGPQVTSFEEAMAARIGAYGVCGVASGTDALVLAMLAAGVRPDDEVIAPSHTAGPTVAAILMTGAIPVLVDVEDDTGCIDARLVATAITPKTRAIIAVHLYGHPADLETLRTVAGSIPLIEDCAQAIDAKAGERKVGSIGDFGCFSFYPTKNLGAVGDGGAVSCARAEDLEIVRQLRTYGWSRPQYADRDGGRCSRLDEIQAAILSVKLTNLSTQIEHRRATAARYRNGFKGLPLRLPVERQGSYHTYHLFVIRSARRNALEAHLARQGIGTGRHYPIPIHQQPAFARRARVAGTMAVTEKLSGEILSLPIFGTMTEAQADIVIDAVQAFA
jgi:dTDP-4-amino-4,6-dideoxygalactose transaminase